MFKIHSVTSSFVSVKKLQPYLVIFWKADIIRNQVTPIETKLLMLMPSSFRYSQAVAAVNAIATGSVHPSAGLTSFLATAEKGMF